jgi:hypothetical protein
MIDRLTKTRTGQILLSVILGLGLAALFRRVCHDCIVIKGPSADEIQKYYYKMENACYKYTPYAVDCAVANAEANAEANAQDKKDALPMHTY